MVNIFITGNPYIIISGILKGVPKNCVKRFKKFLILGINENIQTTELLKVVQILPKVMGY